MDGPSRSKSTLVLLLAALVFSCGCSGDLDTTGGAQTADAGDGDAGAVGADTPDADAHAADDSGADADVRSDADASSQDAGDDARQSDDAGEDCNPALDDRCAPIQIMPFGDSITGDWKPRHGLYERLTDAGYQFDLVGSLDDSWVEDWDSDHDGRAGRATYHVPDEAPDIFEQNQPDVILFMLGTNDYAWWSNTEPAGTADRLETALDILQSEAPNATIFVSTIPPLSSEVIESIDRDRAVLAEEYNAELQQRVQARIDAGESLVSMDINAALSLDDLASDGVHLTEAGYDKVAQVWFEALDEWFSR